MWILVVEDNDNMLSVLQFGLREAGHTVDTAVNGIDGEAAALSKKYDLMILDIMLPGKDGISIVKSVRSAGITTPILLLTGLADIDSRVAGLDAGADDYVPKPFSFEELLARVRALSRRAQDKRLIDETLAVGHIRIDTRRRAVRTEDGEVLMLRLKEYALFELLSRSRDAAVTRTVIAERVWGSLFGVSDDVINMTISSLRQKLKDCQKLYSDRIIEIQTIRGVGYMLTLT